MYKNKTLIIGINLGDYGSTGTIMRNSLEYAHKNGNYDYLVIVPKNKGKPNTFAYKEKDLSLVEKSFYHKFLRQPYDYPDGFYETPYTRRVIKKIKEQAKYYSKVFIHLHNIHMCYLDIRKLFTFFAKNKKITHVFYTLHDEWSFTGGCYVFNYYRCNHWHDNGNKCRNCSFKHIEFDPKSFETKKIYDLKKKYTLKLDFKLTLIPVSNWLNECLIHSFLKNIPTIVNHGECSYEPEIINTNLKKELKLNGKKIILFVSSHWGETKGGKYIYELAGKMPQNCILLVVGGSFDKRKYQNIISIGPVDTEKLKEFYSIADVFVSTSQDESLGLTTCEAQIYGIPVVAFGHAAIKETIVDGKTGYLVGEDNNVNKMAKAILKIVNEMPFAKEDIIKNGERFKKYEHARKMLKIYDDFTTSH